MIDLYARTLADIIALPAFATLTNSIDEEVTARITRAAREIPASSVDYVGFERHLGSSDSAIDFAVCLSPRGADVLSEFANWSTVCRTIDSWQAWIGRPSGGVWLEFDTSRGSQNLYRPNLFLAADRTGSGPLIEPAALTGFLYEANKEEPRFDGRIVRAVERCVALCPEGAKRIWVGLMIQRPGAGVRVCVLPLGVASAVAYLRAIAWPGDVAHVERTLRPFERSCSALCLHVDVGDGPRASVGFELLYDGAPWSTQPSAEPRWHDLLNLLVASKLAKESEKAALLASVSRTVFEAPLIDLLVAAAAPTPTTGKLLHGTLLTGLHHVKLAIAENRRVTAKAYLGAFLDSRSRHS